MKPNNPQKNTRVQSHHNISNFQLDKKNNRKVLPWAGKKTVNKNWFQDSLDVVLNFKAATIHISKNFKKYDQGIEGQYGIKSKQIRQYQQRNKQNIY